MEAAFDAIPAYEPRLRNPDTVDFGKRTAGLLGFDRSWRLTLVVGLATAQKYWGVVRVFQALSEIQMGIVFGVDPFPWCLGCHFYLPFLFRQNISASDRSQNYVDRSGKS